MLNSVALNRSSPQVTFKRSLISLSVFSVVGVGLSSVVWWQQVSAPVSRGGVGSAAIAATEVKQIEVSPGTSADEIGGVLQQQGLIRSAGAWKVWSRWLSWRSRVMGESHTGFQAGVYQVSAAQSLPAIAQTIWTGSVVQQSITIPEGWSIQKMAAYLENEGICSAADFIAQTRQIPYEAYPWLPPNLPHLEGFLFPDTYHLPEGEISPEVLVAQMLAHFEAVALPLYEKAKTQPSTANPNGLSLQEWVTLASIVEKESVVPEEGTRIAGVFTNRLRIGIPLGADPTVEYGLGITQTADRPLTFAEVETPSPYNTYLNAGLPPTPIASPGLSSLKATLQPEKTDYLYFVARYDGTHVFTRTLQEHLAAQSAIWNRRGSSL